MKALLPERSALLLVSPGLQLDPADPPHCLRDFRYVLCGLGGDGGGRVCGFPGSGRCVEVMGPVQPPHTLPERPGLVFLDDRRGSAGRGEPLIEAQC